MAYRILFVGCVLALVFAFTSPVPAEAGFDWGGGGGGGGGSGTFQQQIAEDAVVTVGEIPDGLVEVSISLTSSQDVDIQLVDKATGHKIVAWPDGDLNGSGKETTTWHGVEIEYSGYNGDGTGKGHEYIKILDKTNRTLVMKAFGYAAGYATVNYSWGGGSGGTGSFQQQIAEDAVVEVGEIPTGLSDVSISLTSDKDVDIQLIDKSTGHKIVAWPDGDLSGPTKETTTWHGVEIEYSGFNGDGTGLGHETIRILDTTNRILVMKAFGYQSGYATVTYTWGGGSGGGATGNSGSFQQYIASQGVTEVGVVPAGLRDVQIALTSSTDVDVRLYDLATGDKIVHWPSGILNDSGSDSGSYRGVTIEYSGYNGDGSGKGHEYIKIKGTTNRPLVMGVYGFQSGFAEVAYSWAGGTPQGGLTLDLDQDNLDPLTKYEYVTLSGTAKGFDGQPIRNETFGVHDGLGLKSTTVTTNGSGRFSYTTRVMSEGASVVEVFRDDFVTSMSFAVNDSSGATAALFITSLTIKNDTSSAYGVRVELADGSQDTIYLAPGKSAKVVEQQTSGIDFPFEVTGYAGINQVLGVAAAGGEASFVVDTQGNAITSVSGGTTLLRFSGYGKANDATGEWSFGVCWSPGSDGGASSASYSIEGNLCIGAGNKAVDISLGVGGSVGGVAGGGSITVFQWTY